MTAQPPPAEQSPAPQSPAPRPPADAPPGPQPPTETWFGEQSPVMRPPAKALFGPQSSAPVVPTRPSWLNDERLVRAGWSRLVEPGDTAAFELVARLGPVAAMRSVLEGDGSVGWRTRLPSLDPVRDVEIAHRRGARVIIPGDDEWPEGLDDLEAHRPFCLWVRGSANVGRMSRRSVAIVGARAASAYGERVSREFGDGCARAGITVVSGAAHGVDGAAHKGAIGADGPTIAVLACGIDRVYPTGHTDLLDRIAQVGAVITEIAPGCPPTRWRFIERNRLIAALSRATVVVEAAHRSGALSTAARADRLSRPVAAVPGPVTSMTSYGTHRLLRTGAICVTSADEVAELVGRMGEYFAEQLPFPSAPHDGLDPVDLRVFDALPIRSGAPVESLAQVAGVEQRAVTAALGRLELSRLAERNGQGWRRAPAGRP